MGALSVTRLVKRFAGGVVGVDDVTLTVADGAFTALVGPSGCGKTTILRCVAGLEEPTSGAVHIGGREVTWLPPRDRDVAMVFQNYALYPHLSVRENIGFPLKVRRTASDEVTRRVRQAADLLEIGALLDRKPAQLSGGQRQRVALARAIVREPALFLFDEPLSNLDAQVRAQTRAELVALHRRLGATMLYVTHDQVEAMTMAQSVAVMGGGRVLQEGAPMSLYREPASLAVARFIGSPSINTVAGRTTGTRFDGALSCEAHVPAESAAVLAVRPEALVLGPAIDAAVATVTLVEPLGPESLVRVRLASGEELVARVAGEAPWRAGDAVGVRVAAGQGLCFRAGDGSRLV
ncbi:MAG: ATP-binding cassette domain-containing protein [Gemmatimonadota bacterium]|nr:ATP-binding cassette domain-containing protein [Gemmatimonadota bacterium]